MGVFPHARRIATFCMIGSFPPASGGQGLVNDAFRRMAREAGADVSTIDLSPRPGLPSWRTRISVVPRVLAGLPRLSMLLTRRATTAVYIGVGAGYGQVYDIAFATLARIAGVRLFLHYDSYAYLERRRPLTAALVRMVGPSATHIVLCDDMERRLLKLYGGSLRVVVAPNATNTEVPVSEPKARIKLKTLGFISNLSRTKGVMEFLDVADHVCNAHPDVRAILAGPIEDAYLEPVIRQRVHDAEWLTYIGPVYRERKSGFYSNIDVFLFPTRYINEADPRVISEALAHGVVVVATARGCIGSVLLGGGGAVIDDGPDLVRDAGELLLKWYRDPILFSSISASALSNSAQLNNGHGPRLRALIDEMVSMPQPPVTPA